MVSVLHSLDELSQLLDSRGVSGITKGEDIAAWYCGDEPIGGQVRECSVPKIVEQYEACFEISTKEHCEYVLIRTNISSLLIEKSG